jgi:phage terminase large subunit-like protein
MRSAMAEFMTIAKKQRTYIGTPHAVDSIYTHLQELNYPCLRIAWEKDIWPNHPDKLFTVEWAERYKAQNATWKWNSQYLLIPDSPNTALIDANMINRYSDELQTQEIWNASDNTTNWLVEMQSKRVVDFAAYWDPATGLAGRDNSVFAVVYKDIDNNVYLHSLTILPPKSTHDGYKQQCERIVAKCAELSIARVIVEGTQTDTLDTELKKAAKEKSVWIHIIKKPRTGNKTKFIAEHLEPLVHSKRFYAHSSVPHTFFLELNDFPNGRHDDCIDATAGAIANLRGDVMMLGKSRVITQQVNSTKSISFNKGGNLKRFSK